MTVTELIAKLHALFPRAKDWLLAWSSVFRQVLGGREGDDLRTAVDRTLGAWAEAGCPKPAHFAEHLPALPEPEKRESPLAKADAARHARARQLEEAWTVELHKWFEAATPEGWGWRLRTHLVNLAAWCAQCEANGRSIDDAIARYNGRDRRQGHELRAPGALVDDTDAALWRAQQASQEQFKGLTRGDREPRWNLKRPDDAAPAADPIAAHVAKRRDEINARIPAEARP